MRPSYTVRALFVLSVASQLFASSLTAVTCTAISCSYQRPPISLSSWALVQRYSASQCRLSSGEGRSIRRSLRKLSLFIRLNSPRICPTWSILMNVRCFRPSRTLCRM
ncbi:hypothetical protein BKA63DRAFT_193301 [Paraphoma chrysanthemicola]|nr:hypothetical protein BKA63DRAFT_193301 [Paraphoma chrysanthemicola]